jgi:very-short-patch-repair endonuclease
MDLEEFFSEDKAEPFYVKALEQVQGDERDVVMISVGYGKNSKGTLSHNFGPINQQGGERRLNVLVTRARKQVVLVSSIRYTDVDPNKTSNAGPKLLRNYLEFAEVGSEILDRVPIGSGEIEIYESPFEEHVGEALIRQGYAIRTQIGTSGFRVDMAIVDPRDPGRFLLGIECDGRTYHQSKTARDRDRLRQEKLEDLGWRIHRIWSTEWMKNPDRELQRIRERVDELLAESFDAPKAVPVRPILGPVDEAPVQRASVSLDRVQAVEPVVIAIPYEVAEFATPFTEIWETTPREVAEAVTRIVEIEGPIHRDLLRKRLTNLWGYGRSGQRIASAITRATEVSIQLGRIRQQGEFLWPAASREVQPRSSAENGEVRTIDQIPEEEIATAVRTILSHAFSLETDELLSQTARVFGFQRVGADIRARILSVARQLYVENEVVYKEDRVQLLR